MDKVCLTSGEPKEGIIGTKSPLKEISEEESRVVVVKVLEEVTKEAQSEVIGVVSNEDGDEVAKLVDGGEVIIVLTDDVEEGEWPTVPPGKMRRSQNKASELNFGQISILSKSKFSVLRDSKHDDESLQQNEEDSEEKEMEKFGGIEEETIGKDKANQKSKQAASEVDVVQEVKDKAMDNRNGGNQLGKTAPIRQSLHRRSKNNQKNDSGPNIQKRRIVILAL